LFGTESPATLKRQRTFDNGQTKSLARFSFIISSPSWNDGLGNRIAEMKRLYVRPAYRSLGLGRRLVEAVIHAAQQAAYRELRLDTLASMAPARALYQRLGFQEIAPYSSTYHPDTCFYALRL
jgi:ribosomal protein S18 acetylase RimI-like enzyme